jgi:hypothetical protein
VTRQTKRQTGTSFRCRQPRLQLQITSDRCRILQASPSQLSILDAANIPLRSSRKSLKSQKKSRETHVTSSPALGFSEHIGPMPAAAGSDNCTGNCTPIAVSFHYFKRSAFPTRSALGFSTLHLPGKCTHAASSRTAHSPQPTAHR